MESKSITPRLRFILLPLIGIVLLLTLVKYTDDHLDAIDKDVLLVGVSPDYPPFATEKNNKLVGFDVDLINAIAAKMNKKIKLKESTFQDLIPALLHDEVDVIISGLSINPERAKEIAFTNPYWHSYLVAITLTRSRFNSTQDLVENKKIGVALNSNMEYHARDLFPKAKIITAGSNQILMDKLRLGSLDAVIAENTQLPFLVNNEARFNILPVNDLPIQSYAIGLSKNTRLIDPFNKNIELFKKNDTIQALAAKWNLINEY